MSIDLAKCDWLCPCPFSQSEGSHSQCILTVHAHVLRTGGEDIIVVRTETVLAVRILLARNSRTSTHKLRIVVSIKPVPRVLSSLSTSLLQEVFSFPCRHFRRHRHKNANTKQLLSYISLLSNQSINQPKHDENNSLCRCSSYSCSTSCDGGSIPKYEHCPVLGTM